MQHLDDVAAACPPHKLAMLQKFDETFTWVAKEVGVQLAPRDDKDKAFGPCQKGVVLGVMYDTKQWTWGIPSEKLHRLRLLLKDTLLKDSVKQHVMWTIVGKIIHIKPLIPGGKFNIDYLLRVNSLRIQDL